MSFVFYDTETTGTKTSFDQILQFAGVKTDDNFNVLDQLNIRCRLLPHIVPSPGALLATRVSPAMLMDAKLPSHYEAIRQIQATLKKWSPAIFIGFNSLKFDEHLLRQALFQTLHTAYLTNTNGNTRSDVMRIAHAVSAYAPTSLVVPIDDRGLQTFRLDRLAPANGYNHMHAHEAMADVEATIYLARLLSTKAPEVWKLMDRAKRKLSVQQFLQTRPTFYMTERYFGRTHSWLVTLCGKNPNYDAEFAVFDLQYDPGPYLSLSIPELAKVLNATPKVIRSLRANSLPIIAPADMAPADVRCPPEYEAQRRILMVRGNHPFQERVGKALALRFASARPSPYVEERLYDGFPNHQDNARMTRFHDLDWSDRATLAEGFEDPRIAELAHRLIYFKRRDLLPSKKAAELDLWRAERILTDDAEVPWMTVAKALAEAEEMMRSEGSKDAALLSEVKKFIIDLEKSARRGTIDPA